MPVIVYPKWPFNTILNGTDDLAEKYMTLAEQSLETGVYKFDLYDAKVYNRYDVVNQIFDLQQKLGKS